MKNVVIVVIVLVVFAISGYMMTRQITPPVSSPPVPEATPAPETAPTPTPVSAAPVQPAVSSAPVVTPVSAAPAAPAKGTAVSPASLTVARMVIAAAIEDRKPVGIAASFPASQEKIYCYLELTNVTKDQRITYAWSYGGATDKVTQQIKKAERWRTWNYRVPAGKKGDWKVDILNESGTVLKSASFKVK